MVNVIVFHRKRVIGNGVVFCCLFPFSPFASHGWLDLPVICMVTFYGTNVLSWLWFYIIKMFFVDSCLIDNHTTSSFYISIVLLKTKLSISTLLLFLLYWIRNILLTFATPLQFVNDHFLVFFIIYFHKLVWLPIVRPI